MARQGGAAWGAAWPSSEVTKSNKLGQGVRSKPFFDSLE